MNILDCIPTGRMNAAKREGNDRKLRKAISDANLSGDLIINNGAGYYRPDLNDPIDRMEARKYVFRERRKALTIIEMTNSVLSTLSEECANV